MPNFKSISENIWYICSLANMEFDTICFRNMVGDCLVFKAFQCHITLPTNLAMHPRKTKTVHIYQWQYCVSLMTMGDGSSPTSNNHSVKHVITSNNVYYQEFINPSWLLAATLIIFFLVHLAISPKQHFQKLYNLAGLQNS